MNAISPSGSLMETPIPVKKFAAARAACAAQAATTLCTITR
jgi:hypothetical protein